MDADPHSLITTDNKKSNVFHYCCEYKNDVLFASMLTVLRRLSSHQSVRIQVKIKRIRFIRLFYFNK